MIISKQDMMQPKIGELRFPVLGSNVEVPEVVLVTSATARQAYVNGEKTDTISKIALTVVDSKLAEIAKENGLSIESFPTIFAEIQDTKIVKALAEGLEEKVVGKVIPTKGALIALRWTGFGDRGRWGGIKLVFSSSDLMSQSSASGAGKEGPR